MEVQVVLEKWAVEEVEGSKRIIGKYAIKCGATKISTEDFNGQYNSQKVPFSTQLLVDIENIDKKIRAELTANFTGKEV